jgi:hypothetical protein
MKLKGRIELKEREIELARETIAESYGDMRRVMHRRLSSRTALVLSFGSGVALGLLRRRRQASPPEQRRVELPKRAREAMPKHWLGHYIVWPFLLATARDWVVSRRPSSQSPP